MPQDPGYLESFALTQKGLENAFDEALWQHWSLRCSVPPTPARWLKKIVAKFPSHMTLLLRELTRNQMKVPTRTIPRLPGGPRGSLPPSCATSVSCGRIPVILKELEDNLLAEAGGVVPVPAGAAMAW